ncbi:MAG: Flp pilus assembly complex ATPase component TadA [Myxococcales bacterium]|nr:Flp pilus assembly complex ATPase component TadA [Myxococcales bacterium]
MSDSMDRFGIILRFAAERHLTDVHFKAGQRPLYRRAGRLISRREEATFDDVALTEIAGGLFNAEQAQAFNEGEEVTTSYGLVGTGRFRVHVFRQRGTISLAARVLPSRVVSIRELHLPQATGSLVNAESGLVLVCSGGGQGRTSTLAAMIDAVNTASQLTRHVATVESPIEVLFEDKLAWISQREVGIDCNSYVAGIKGALKQDPDVLMVDDVGDRDVWDAVLGAAESGCLVVACVRAMDLSQMFRYLIGLGGEQEAGWRSRLAGLFLGAISTKLVHSADGKARYPACEVLMANDVVYTLVRDGHDPATLYDVMHQHQPQGMQTIDQSLHDMLNAKVITGEIALAHAMRPAELQNMRSTGARYESGLF